MDFKKITKTYYKDEKKNMVCYDLTPNDFNFPIPRFILIFGSIRVERVTLHNNKC